MATGEIIVDRSDPASIVVVRAWPYYPQLGRLTSDDLVGGLIDARMALKNPAWVMNSGALHNVAKLRDGTGQYLINHLVKDNEPMRLLGLPIVTDDDVPDGQAMICEIMADINDRSLIATVRCPRCYARQIPTGTGHCPGCGEMLA